VRATACLSDDEIMRIAQDIITLKKEYGNKHIDTEGALDDSRNVVFLQARPETRYSSTTEITMTVVDEEKSPAHRTVLFEGGICASSGAATGILQYLPSDTNFDKVRSGVILVTPRTDHRWTPKFSGLKGVITDLGGRNDHAGITGRQLGLPALVDTGNGSAHLKDFDGRVVTLDAVNGKVYLGALPIKTVTELREIWLSEPERLPLPKEGEAAIDILWDGATKAGQTFVDQAGMKWIGRPNYPLRELQQSAGQ